MVAHGRVIRHVICERAFDRGLGLGYHYGLVALTIMGLMLVIIGSGRAVVQTSLLTLGAASFIAMLGLVLVFDERSERRVLKVGKGI